MRICILSRDNIPLGFLDNDLPEALHFYDDKLHTYLKGTANTFEFTVNENHEDANLLEVGNKLSFYYNAKPYYLNIVKTEQTEIDLQVEAWALSLELTNEQAAAYTATSAMTFEQYLTAFGFMSDVFVLGVNEVSSKTITHEWTGDNDTILKRLFSLASVFDAEIEFIPQLNQDYSLSEIVMNVYKTHSDAYQGVGERKNDTYFRYGKGVDGVTKKQDITELYTCIRPTGADDLTIQSIGARTHTDSEGNVAYTHASGARSILAPIAAERFPSTVGSDKYIVYNWKTDYKEVETLYGNALAKLKEISEPVCEYEIKGFLDVNIGDTVTIIDEAFNPPLYLETRVTEQEISFTDKSKNETKFENTNKWDE